MKYQPKTTYISNDRVMTPRPLAKAIVEHFSPSGVILEPSSGEGAFLDALPHNTLSCEIDQGKDFFDFTESVDWVIGNPPWSQIRQFLLHGMQISRNVVFLMTINHAWTKARLRDVKDLGFGIKEIVLCDTPKEFPASGFQLGVVHYQAGWKGDIKFSTL